MDDSGSEEDALGALQDDQGEAGTKPDKESAEPAKTGEISISLLNRASGYVCLLPPADPDRRLKISSSVI